MPHDSEEKEHGLPPDELSRVFDGGTIFSSEEQRARFFGKAFWGGGEMIKYREKLKKLTEIPLDELKARLLAIPNPGPVQEAWKSLEIMIDTFDDFRIYAQRASIEDIREVAFLWTHYLQVIVNEGENSSHRATDGRMAI